MRLSDTNLFRTACYVGGEWRKAAAGDTFAVTNPATGEKIGTVPQFDADDTRATIDIAEAAWAEWRSLPAKTRANLLRRWFELVLEHQEDLAVIMTTEQGKPLAEARGEVLYGASFIEWFAEETKRIYGDTIDHPLPGHRILVIKQPIGVCAAITPWNFPAAMITRKCAPALGAGCPVIVKPAEQTPFTALALAELAHRAGLPPGIFNVITGQPEIIGHVLTESAKVRKLSFTGSTEVGKLLMSQCAGTIKKISLELGGNAPFIIFDDADVDAAVAGALASKYRNSGQTCVCANRFLVQEGTYVTFAEKFTRAVEGLTVGNGFDEGVQQGPLIDSQALRKVETHIADAVAKGAQLVTGGHRHALGGTYFEPTVLTNVKPDMVMTQEETFGPVAPLISFRDEAEAVALANDTPFGLAAYFYSRDIGRIWRVAEALEFGLVGINAGIISTEVAPFGGVKQSGLGREGSKYGMAEYLEIKYLCLAGIDR